MKNNNGTAKQAWERLGELWCKLAHPQPMWPIHGHYQCPKCLRLHPVAWENEGRQASAKPPAMLGGIHIVPRANAGARAAA